MPSPLPAALAPGGPRPAGAARVHGSRPPRAVLVVVASVVAAGCTAREPSMRSLAAEPVLTALPGAVELTSITLRPRRARIGTPSRDGVVERVVAVDLLPAAAADLLQQGHDTRYGFRRVDLGVGTPVTVELRGTSPTGADVIVTATSGRPVPLYGSPDDVLTVPTGRPTTVVLSIVSRQ